MPKLHGSYSRATIKRKYCSIFFVFSYSSITLLAQTSLNQPRINIFIERVYLRARREGLKRVHVMREGTNGKWIYSIVTSQHAVNLSYLLIICHVCVSLAFFSRYDAMYVFSSIAIFSHFLACRLLPYIHVVNWTVGKMWTFSHFAHSAIQFHILR